MCCCFQILLPQFIVGDIEKLIILYNGDLIILRDLKEMYNQKAGDLYLGVPGPYINFS